VLASTGWRRRARGGAEEEARHCSLRCCSLSSVPLYPHRGALAVTAGVAEPTRRRTPGEGSRGGRRVGSRARRRC
jgi:hypothetical protein